MIAANDDYFDVCIPNSELNLKLNLNFRKMNLLYEKRSLCSVYFFLMMKLISGAGISTTQI